MRRCRTAISPDPVRIASRIGKRCCWCTLDGRGCCRRRIGHGVLSTRNPFSVGTVLVDGHVAASVVIARGPDRRGSIRTDRRGRPRCDRGRARGAPSLAPAPVASPECRRETRSPAAACVRDGGRDGLVTGTGRGRDVVDGPVGDRTARSGHARAAHALAGGARRPGRDRRGLHRPRIPRLLLPGLLPPHPDVRAGGACWPS